MMKSVNQEEDQLPEAKPMKVGATTNEVERIIDELSHTGVAADGQDVERAAYRGEDVVDPNSSLGEPADKSEEQWDAAIAPALFRI